MITKAGLRLSSVVCDTEVIVIKAPKEDLDLRCGGQPMVELAEGVAKSGAPVPPFDTGTLIGTKAGAGTLSIAETVLPAKEAQPLPSSD